MRLYSFVADLYLSPLQRGLQSTHVCSELSVQQNETYNEWAKNHKAVIILSALNQAGVLSAYDLLKNFCSTAGLPCALFREDEQSMNNMATACGAVIPEIYYSGKFVKDEWEGNCGPTYSYVVQVSPFLQKQFNNASFEYAFADFLRSYRLAAS